MNDKYIQCDYCKTVYPFIEHKLYCAKCGAQLPLLQNNTPTPKAVIQPEHKPEAVFIPTVTQQELEEYRQKHAEEKQPTAPIKTDKKLLGSFLFFIGALLFFVAAYTYDRLYAPVNLPQEKRKTPTATFTAAPTITKTPTGQPIGDVTEWVNFELDLLGIRGIMPPGWTVTPVNYQEATITSGECSDYIFVSPDQSIILTLMPMCGDGSPGSDTCPPGTTINQFHPYISRYYDNNRKTYLYIKQFTGQNNQIICVEDIEITAKKYQSDWMFAKVELIYSGKENIDSVLATTDLIVASIGRK